MPEDCSNCFFVRTRAQPHTIDGNRAVSATMRSYCHYYPPQPGEPEGAGAWQPVDDDWWCGHWSSDGTIRMQSVGPAGATGAQGVAGTNGSNGAAGATGAQGIPGISSPQWTLQASPRLDSAGNNGDWYILTGDPVIFYEKVTGTWTERVRVTPAAP